MDDEKPLYWVGSSLDDLRRFPDDVQDLMGYALQIAKWGGKHPDAKPLRGFKGASTLEVVEDYDGDTYRASIRFSSEMPFMYSMPSRRNRNRASRRPRRTWI